MCLFCVFVDSVLSLCFYRAASSQDSPTNLTVLQVIRALNSLRVKGLLMMEKSYLLHDVYGVLSTSCIFVSRQSKKHLGPWTFLASWRFDLGNQQLLTMPDAPSTWIPAGRNILEMDHRQAHRVCAVIFLIMHIQALLIFATDESHRTHSVSAVRGVLKDFPPTVSKR